MRVRGTLGLGTVGQLLDRVDDIQTQTQKQTQKTSAKESLRPKSKTDTQALQLAALILTMSDNRRALSEEEKHSRVKNLQPSKAGSTPTDIEFCMQCMGLAEGSSQKAAKEAKVLGQGYHGKVFSVHIPLPGKSGKSGKSGTTEVAVKMEDLEANTWNGTLAKQLKGWRQEVIFATRAGILGAGPKVQDAFICTLAGVTSGVIVMDLARGVSLVTWRQERAAFPDEVSTAEEIAIEKVKRLHAAGMYHGDLHAGNVMVIPARYVKGVGNRKGKVKGNGKEKGDALHGEGVSDVLLVDYGFGLDAAALAEYDLEALNNLEDGRRPRKDIALKRQAALADQLFRTIGVT